MGRAHYSCAICLIAGVYSTVMSTAEPFAPSPHMGWLVVDFDGTCTERDTTPLLPKLTAILQGDSDVEEAERLAVFKELEMEFLSLYAASKEKLDDPTLTFEQALSSLDEPSNIVTHKVSQSGILNGLAVSADKLIEIIQSNDQIRDHVMLKPGCLQVLEQLPTNKWKLGILSINWCPSLIEAALLSHLESPNVPIWSNQVDQNGRVALLVPGAVAKKERIAKLKAEADASTIIIYIGDSTTDLMALVEADVGILIGESKSTMDMARKWGIPLVPIADRPATEPFLSPKGGGTRMDVIWLAKSWLEIGEHLQ